MKSKAEDKLTAERDEGVVVKVTTRDDCWEVSWDRDRGEAKLGWTFILRFEDCPDGMAPPEAGDPITVYGGLGHPIHGVDLRGREVYYYDDLDRALKQEAAQARSRLEQAESFDREDVVGRYEALPDLFRRRIDKFTDTLGPRWWWEYGPYELMCCTDAVTIGRAAADALGLEPGLGIDADELKGEVEGWFKAGHAERVDGVEEGHSGNSWGFAQRLAWLWIVAPDMVVQEHGALVPLVGCRAYGCPHPDSESKGGA